MGLSAIYSKDENTIVPGFGVNINFMPTFASYNDNLMGLKLDIFISGMIYKEDSTGLNDDSWDLDINQIQTIDLIYRRNFKSGNIDVSILPLLTSESEFIIFTRLAYKIPLKNNFIEFFIRRFADFKYPQVGVIYQW